MKFDIYIDGEYIDSHSNIITDKGYEGLLKYVIRSSRSWVGAMSIGVGSTTPAKTDRFLDFEVTRQGIEAAETETDEGTVLFKATFPQDLVAEIHEFGLHSLVQNVEADGDSRFIASFDPNKDGFEGNFVETGARVGTSALVLNIGEDATYSDFHIDLDQYKDDDLFVLAAWGLGDVEIQFIRNQDNYFTVTKTIPTDYSFVTTSKAEFTEIGNMAWSDVRSIKFICSSGTVNLDALSVRDVDEYEEFFLVARSITSTPLIKPSGRELNIEYRARLTVE